MGSSFISTGNEASSFSRFHFRPHFLQHASFRLVEQEINSSNASEFVTSDTDAPGPYVGTSYPFRRSKEGVVKAAAAEKRHTLSLDMARFFTGSTKGLPYMLKATKEKTFDDMKSLILHHIDIMGLKRSDCNVIEVGCGAGQLVFPLAAHVRSVVGIDHNNDYIDIAKKLQQGSVETYSVRGEGVLRKEIHVSVDSLTDASTASDKSLKNNRLCFRTADPMCLPAELHDFDVVYLNDIIDKVSSPNSVLGRVGGARGLVKKGGILILSSCFQWEESKTPKQLWLGGYENPSDSDSGSESSEGVSSVETIKDRFENEFTLVSRQDFPMTWMETERDFRLKLLDVTVWKRNG